jgi:hypothetical protein
MDDDTHPPSEPLPDDDLYADYVRRKIAAGIKAADEGRLVPHEEVRRRFCLDPE